MTNTIEKASDVVERVKAAIKQDFPIVHNTTDDKGNWCVKPLEDAFFERTATKAIDAYESHLQAQLTAARAVWQDISTAPKDGTGILVYTDIATVPVVHIAWYRNADEWERSGQYCGGWESLEEWEGWWSYVHNSISQEKLEGFKEPTHWMPLPKAPTTTGEPA